jgi:hypothetical protein
MKKNLRRTVVRMCSLHLLILSQKVEIALHKVSFSSPEDLMKNLPKTMSNMFGAGRGMSRDFPTF